MKKHLIAGPWVGEFGWELFCWQSHLRAISYQFDHVTVLGPAGHKPIYEDFVDDYRVYPPHPIPNARPDCQNLIVDGKKWQMLRGAMGTHSNSRTTWLQPKDVPVKWDPVPRLKVSSKFIRFGSDPGMWTGRFDVVFHARSRQWSPERNWPKGNWFELHAEIGNANSCVGIGTEKEAMRLTCDDYRGESLKDQMFALHHAQLCVGPSSGPMALALLCGCPVVTWSGNRKDVPRFESVWNPFGVKVKLLETWQPSVKSVLAAVEEML